MAKDLIRTKGFVDPVTGQVLGEGVTCLQIKPSGGSVITGFPLPKAWQPLYDEALREHLRSQGHDVPPVFRYTHRIRSHAVGDAHRPAAGITNVLAVGSGKGGVGKTTVAVHLADALKRLGARVGYLDADIYGPNAPESWGVHGQRCEVREGRFVPLDADGVALVSMGLMVDPEQPMVWRGPMVSKALQQLFFQTHWPELDYLIVDLPPGTGDVQLTMSQKLPVAGAVVVTTPQTLALQDARRGVDMFHRVKVPVLGVVENMSFHDCPACGERDHPFGHGVGDALGDVPVIERLGLMRAFQERAQSEAMCELFERMALKVAIHLAMRPIDYRGAFPDIKLQQD